MYLRPSKNGFVLWNSTTAMRRNGHQPSRVAAFLCSEFGIEVVSQARKQKEEAYPFAALAFFERLVIRQGVKAPSLISSAAWGRA